MLSTHRVVNLAYTDKSGSPQSCALWYASDNLRLYYLSSLSTQHGKSLQDGGKIAFTINRDDQNWQEIQGIQGQGFVRPIGRNSIAWQVYIQKFPFVTDQFSDLNEALQNTQIWEINPTWIRYIDNSISFGHKEELDLDIDPHD